MHLIVYLFILFQLVHQSQLVSKHYNVILLKINNEYKLKYCVLPEDGLI